MHDKCIEKWLYADLKYYVFHTYNDAGSGYRIAHTPVHRPYPLLLLHYDIVM